MEKRYVQFDGLRAFAVLVVLYQHWVWLTYSAEAYDRWYHYILKLPVGRLGVPIFFVLSGFLITEILLRCKNCEPPEKQKFIKAFYIRRALRILPIYFLTLGVTTYFALEPFREYFWWLALFSTNILIYLKGDWIGLASHLWTLAVEEQFYLFWPLLAIFFTRNFEKLAICLVVGSMITRVVTVVFYPEQFFLPILPLISMDSLAIGGLLALRSRTTRVIETAVKPLACLVLLLYPLGAIGVHNLALYFLAQIADVVVAAYLVSGASRGFTGLLGQVLSSSPVRYLGLISYGLYLYHMFAGQIAQSIAGDLGASLWMNNFTVKVFSMLLVTITCGTLSWILIERPINNLKRLFPYFPDKGMLMTVPNSPLR